MQHNQYKDLYEIISLVSNEDFFVVLRRRNKFSCGHLLLVLQLAGYIEGTIHLRISVFLYHFFSELWKNRGMEERYIGQISYPPF